MCVAITNPADRSFVRRCRVCVSVFLVLYLGCLQLARQNPNGSLRLIFAGIAGASFFAELISVGLLLMRIRDEFQRILLIRSFLWATIVTMGVATVWGFMEAESRESLPHIPVLALPAIVICATAATKLLIFRRYRSPAE